jgi:hypothetical protein
MDLAQLIVLVVFLAGALWFMWLMSQKWKK